jgi:2-C-methyl-D-erythritol 4-phosphate cytidylyltransferase
MLGNKPIFIHTIEQFLLNSKVDKILLCCPKAWMSHAKDTINKYLKENNNIIVVEGGKTRQETILNGCEYILNEFGINDDDIILTHDAVRPFVTQRIIDDNIKFAKKYGAVDTVIASTDTIVESIDGKLISNIPIRKQMYQGQTPQSFNLKTLVNLLSTLTEEEKNILTDACKAFTLKGKEVYLVDGEVYNMKITTLHDLKLSNAILMERGNK